MDEKSNSYWNSYLPVFMDRMSSLMRSHMTEVVSPYELTSAHAIYLIALEINGPMSQREMSSFLDLDVANTNRVVKKLKEKGMIYDDRVNLESKNYKYHLTRVGSQIAKKLMDSTDEWMESIMSKVSIEDIMNMRNTLLTILKEMDPKLEGYMSSENKSYYYTYLGTNPAIDGWKYHISNRVDDEK